MKKFLILITLFSLFSISFAMEIRYFGHACFRIQFNSGYSVIIDPFSSNYPIPQTTADLIISSHEHGDHYNPNFLGKKVEVIVGTKDRGTEWNLFEKKIEDIKIWNVPTFHDDAEGKKRGKNSITVIDGEGIRLVHLGDLGIVLTEKEIKLLGKVDILFIPVGGYYTLSQEEALKVINQINPKVVIPMHYKTEYTQGWPIGTLEEFLKLVKELKIVKFESSLLNISKDKLPKTTEIWILNYK
ncbi:MAG: MBL fold metallo-hydrolase [Dictyoglomus sp.]|nr:MBL fold metallo-hydrolase [Dictyoglomus sp.]MCX7942125.1 MBL fold metallo-hydrolase [Dictyoglomaceae bacterium]MDW8188012.1 MBL fold metallo-hydrolase [Dictyoglomus sp.]